MQTHTYTVYKTSSGMASEWLGAIHVSPGLV